MKTRCAILLFLTALVQCALVRAEPRIVIEKLEPTVEIVEFDAANPPANLPKLSAKESAYCRFDFHCAVSLTASSQTAEPDAGSASPGRTVAVESTITAAKVTLSLKNTIYVPKDAPAKLRAHEDGHRKLNEQLYALWAREAAEKAIAEAIAQQWRGAGPTPRAAADAATQKAIDAICQSYLKRIIPRVQAANDVFDELTAHGVNDHSDADAIREAIKRAIELKH